jgi:multidrug efflux system membrane fusion protein
MKPAHTSFRTRVGRSAVLLATTLAAAASLAVLSGCSGQAGAQGGPPGPAPVSVAPAVQRTVADNEEFSGRLEAAEFVELRPRVGGVIEKVHFTDGALVSRGQLLFTIDTRPFAAEVARLESQLAAAKARAELAGTELARAQKLLESKAASRQEVDQLAAGARTSQAEIQAAEAALRAARLSLEFTAVRAPIAGRASAASFTAGNLVNEQVVLTTIAGTGRVHAYFDASEQTFLRVRAGGEKAPAVRMALSNEGGAQGYPHVGKVDFFDNRLNPQTGAIRMRATFDNSKGQFLPGLAVRLVMATTAPYAAVMVPERAIGTDQNKKFVVVVGADGQPQFRDVQLGALQDGMRVVGGGQLKAGENVVVDGLQRIIPGVPVAPQVLKVDERGMPLPPAPPAPPAAKKA